MKRITILITLSGITVLVVILLVIGQYHLTTEVNNLTKKTIHNTMPHIISLHKIRFATLRIVAATHEISHQSHMTLKQNSHQFAMIDLGKKDFEEGIIEYNLKDQEHKNIEANDNSHKHFIRSALESYRKLQNESDAIINIHDEKNLDKHQSHMHSDAQHSDHDDESIHIEEDYLEHLEKFQNEKNKLINLINNQLEVEAKRNTNELNQALAKNDNNITMMISIAIMVIISVIFYVLYIINLVRKIHRFESELLEKNKRLLQKSIEDPLTHLFNRSYFFETAESYASASRRFNASCAIAILDIDFFKKVNDKYGHLAGDQALLSLSDILKSKIKRRNDLVARYGGEEFCIFLFDIDGEHTEKFMEELRKTVEDITISYNDAAFKFTISIGAHVSTNKEVEEMLSLADENLYQAKENGRNRVVVSTCNPLSDNKNTPCRRATDRIDSSPE